MPFSDVNNETFIEVIIQQDELNSYTGASYSIKLKGNILRDSPHHGDIDFKIKKKIREAIFIKEQINFPVD